jgi:hypothetical protein
MMPRVLLISKECVLKVNGSGEKSLRVPKMDHFFKVTFLANPAKVECRSLTNYGLSHTCSNRILCISSESAVFLAQI